MSLAENLSGPAGGNAVADSIRAILDKQRKAHIKEGPVPVARRIDWLNRSIDLLVNYKQQIVDALVADFGHRSPDQTVFTDVADALESLKHARKHLPTWINSSSRKVTFPLGLFGARARVDYQAKGVIGVISPWNFPINLTFKPMAGIFAAGNRVMIKPSEYTPATSELMARMIREAYDETEAAVITGGPAVGEAFSRMPFDHLVFTGATSIARHVMRAAAENLVPLTLELGGKSPVIIGKGADIKTAASRIMFGKTLNAGQICLAPDYVMVPEGKTDAFATAATNAVKKMYPTLKDNPDYTSIVNQRHFDRLQGYLEDAKKKGAKLVELNPAKEDFRQQPYHKIPPTLILEATDDMKVMQDEIFGPLLPVRTYKAVDDAIGYVNDHDRPLGLYYFGNDKAEEERVLTRTTSGGVTVNDVIMHVAMEDLPFGGIGPSGMGSYHGFDGFLAFSHAKAVYRQVRMDLTAMLRPPYGEKFRKLIGGRVTR